MDMEQDFIIANQHGVHARPGTNLAKIANRFKSEITLTYNGITVDMKSIIGVLSLGIKRGASITVSIYGEDDNEAMKEIGKYIKEINMK